MKISQQRQSASSGQQRQRDLNALTITPKIGDSKSIQKKSVLAIFNSSEKHNNHETTLSHRHLYQHDTNALNHTPLSIKISNNSHTPQQHLMNPQLADDFNTATQLLSINTMQLQQHIDKNNNFNRQGLQTAPSKVSQQQSIFLNSSSKYTRTSPSRDRYSTTQNYQLSHPQQLSPRSQTPPLNTQPFAQIFPAAQFTLPSDNNTPMRKQSALNRTPFTSHRMFRPQPLALLQKQWNVEDQGEMMQKVVANNDNSNYYYLTAKNSSWNIAKDKWIQTLSGCLLSQPVQINDNAQLKSRNLLKQKNTQHRNLPFFKSTQFHQRQALLEQIHKEQKQLQASNSQKQAQLHLKTAQTHDKGQINNRMSHKNISNNPELQINQKQINHQNYNEKHPNPLNPSSLQISKIAH